MRNLFLTDTPIPAGYEYLLDARMPLASLILSIVGLVLILGSLAAMIIVLAKKHKSSFLTIFLGVFIYGIFNILLVYFLTAFAPSKNVVVQLIYGALIASAIPLLGRILVIKLCSQQYYKLGDHFGYGVGNAIMKSVMSIISLATPIVNYCYINKYGIAYFFTSDMESDAALEMAKSIVTVLEYDYVQCVLMAIVTISVMVYGLAITLPIYAAFTGKKSKGWFGFVFGTSFLITLGEGMFNNDVLVIPSIIIVAAVAALSVYFALKLYKEVVNDKEEDKPKKESSDISKNAHVKVPRFKDLDKL